MFWGVHISIAFFLLSFVLKKILKKVKGKNRILNALYFTFAYKSRSWVLLTLLLESGLFKLCFDGFNQLSTPYSFTFSNKLNMAFSICILFAIILYASTFYVMVNRFHPNSSAILLASGKETRKGFLLEILTYSSCKIVKSFIHSNVIQYHPNKMLCLIVFDVVQIMLTLRLRKFFINYAVMFMNMMYNLTFLLLDLQLYLKFQEKAF